MMAVPSILRSRHCRLLHRHLAQKTRWIPCHYILSPRLIWKKRRRQALLGLPLHPQTLRLVLPRRLCHHHHRLTFLPGRRPAPLARDHRSGFPTLSLVVKWEKEVLSIPNFPFFARIPMMQAFPKSSRFTTSSANSSNMVTIPTALMAPLFFLLGRLMTTKLVLLGVDRQRRAVVVYPDEKMCLLQTETEHKAQIATVPFDTSAKPLNIKLPQRPSQLLHKCCPTTNES